MVAVRDAPAGGIEVFLLRDRASPRYWFPSSRVQDLDASATVMARCHGVTKAMARQYLDHRKSARGCLSHWIAASRELFVSAGLIFCTQGDVSTPLEPATHSRLLAQRPSVEAHALDFGALLKAEDVFCDLRFLVPFAKWHTPCGHGKGRTEIFIARVLRQGDGYLWQSQTTGDWLAPVGAMVQWQRGRISVDFKTFSCLRMLADFPNVERLFWEYRLED